MYKKGGINPTRRKEVGRGDSFLPSPLELEDIYLRRMQSSPYQNYHSTLALTSFQIALIEKICTDFNSQATTSSSCRYDCSCFSCSYTIMISFLYLHNAIGHMKVLQELTSSPTHFSQGPTRRPSSSR